jgi:hypothetical protein
VPRLSILIPCLGGSAEFESTLVSVLQNRPPRCEVLVLHTAPYDDPYRLTGEVQFLRCERARSLVELVNAGIEAARGEILHVLACGLEASDGWTEAALPHFDDDEVAAVIPAVVGSQSQAISTGLRVTLGGRRRVLKSGRLAGICGPTLAAGFYRREVLAALAGFDTIAGDQWADAGFALDLQELGLRATVEVRSRIQQTSDPLAGSKSSGFKTGIAAERVFGRNAARVGLPLALAPHLLTVLADVGQFRLPHLLGRAAAWVLPGELTRQSRRLEAAAARLAEQTNDSPGEEQQTLPLPARAATAGQAARRRAA